MKNESKVIKRHGVVHRIRRRNINYALRIQYEFEIDGIVWNF